MQMETDGHYMAAVVAIIESINLLYLFDIKIGKTLKEIIIFIRKVTQYRNIAVVKCLSRSDAGRFNRQIPIQDIICHLKK